MTASGLLIRTLFIPMVTLIFLRHTLGTLITTVQHMAVYLNFVLMERIHQDPAIGRTVQVITQIILTHMAITVATVIQTCGTIGTVIIVQAMATIHIIVQASKEKAYKFCLLPINFTSLGITIA